MKNSKNIIMIVCMIIILLVIVFGFIIYNLNTVKTLKCESTLNNLKIEYKGNNVIHLSGILKYKKNDETNILEKLAHYDDFLTINKNKNIIKYSVNYSIENQGIINSLGLQYNDNMTYKQFKKELLKSNYYCK